jgi:cytochrome c-type biogenesis protein CcmH
MQSDMNVPKKSGECFGAAVQGTPRAAMKRVREVAGDRARGVARALVLAVALSIGALVPVGGALAQQSTAPAAAPSEMSPANAERFRKLSEELRCLVCQNQTLADSHAELAGDLRREVEAQMAQGKSDDEIKAYLVARYGDFVLYRPPVQSNTMFLWFGPFALLLVGAVAWLFVQRRSRARRAEAPVTPDDERERARKMLE